MKFFFRIFLALISVLVFLVRSPLYAATPIEIVNNLGIATPTTQFGDPGSSGLTISPRQFVGPQFIPTESTLITEIGGFANNSRSAVRILGIAPVSRLVSWR
jgi:hypothetical protein